MTIVVITGDSEWMEPHLVEVPIEVVDDTTKKMIEEIVLKELGLDGIDIEEAQIFELEPLAAERLAQAEWQETWDDSQAYEQNLHKAIVYAAFAKGGPVKLECLEEE